MRWSSRSTREALLAFALLAILILGGVTWGTIATLRLERSAHEARIEKEHQNKIAQARTRLDSVVGRVVQFEEARPVRDYTSYYSPSALFQADWTEAQSESFIQASPLVNAELESWIELHFQVSPDNDWQSPQLPDIYPSYDSSIPRPDPGMVVRTRDSIRALKSACVSYETLGTRLEKANATARRYESLAKGADHDTTKSLRPRRNLASRKPLFSPAPRFDRWTKTRTSQLPAEVCSWDGQVPGGAMTPVWLGCEGNPHHQLTFIRSVDWGGGPYFQGFAVDWESLKAVLLAEIEDLFPSADLLPVDDDTVSDIRRLLSKPFAEISVDPPVMTASSWTSTHLLLVVAWLAALAILGGVGVGIESLLALTERRTQFAYAVTHELRTPLTTLRLYTDMLVSGLVPDKDRDRYFVTLRDEAERLSDLVNGVLEYARVENRSVKLDIQETTVSTLLESIREHCGGRCDDAGKKLVLDVNGLGTSTIVTDAKLVRQVVTNLIDNACKHTRGAADPTITLRAHAQPGDKISLEVEDHGPGIDSSDRQHIFRPYRRARTGAPSSSGGIGLGLALAKSWARLLGGNLELAPDSGQGTCFRLTMPRSRK